MDHQHPVLGEEGPRHPKRVATQCSGVTFDLLGVVVAQVHGVDVVGHVGSAERGEAVNQPVAARGGGRSSRINIHNYANLIDL